MAEQVDHPDHYGGVVVKICSTCEQMKPLLEYPPDLRRKDGRGARCRICADLVRKGFYAKYPQKEAERRRRNAQHGMRWYNKNRKSQIVRMKWTRVLKLYGITQQRYDEMLLSQDGRCAICSTYEAGRGDGYFAIDHDHGTNKVRGLLCQKCNCGIGFFGDDVERMKRAIAYVEKRR